MSKKNALKLASALVCAAVLTPVAIAATTTTTFQVTATVVSVCSVSATDLAFGNYDASSGTPTDATSTVTVTCTPSETYDVGLDAGTTGTIAVRQMTSGANTLDYSLYSDSPGGTVWGDTVGVDTVAGTGNGAGQALTVHGRIPTGQYVAAGAYTDTITATVTY